MPLGEVSRRAFTTLGGTLLGELPCHTFSTSCRADCVGVIAWWAHLARTPPLLRVLSNLTLGTIKCLFSRDRAWLAGRVGFDLVVVLLDKTQC